MALLFCQAQTTVTLIADYDCSIGYDNYPNNINQNFNTAVQNAAYTIPGTGGGLNVNRALIHFDLSTIPSNATITSAQLNLYALGQNGTLNGHTGSANQSYLQRVTQSWTATTVTWNNQPSTTTSNQVTLPGTTQPLLDYTNINVTQMVQDMMATSNHGFMLRLVNEVPTYRKTSGVFTQTFSTTMGCDSIEHIQLMVTEVDTSIVLSGITLTANQSGATYQWINCEVGFSMIRDRI